MVMHHYNRCEVLGLPLPEGSAFILFPLNLSERMLWLSVFALFPPQNGRVWNNFQFMSCSFLFSDSVALYCKVFCK